MTKEKKIAIVDGPIIKQKRGRKSKKDLQLAAEQKLISKEENTIEIINEDNITCSIQEISENNETDEETLIREFREELDVSIILGTINNFGAT